MLSALKFLIASNSESIVSFLFVNSSWAILLRSSFNSTLRPILTNFQFLFPVWAEICTIRMMPSLVLSWLPLIAWIRIIEHTATLWSCSQAWVIKRARDWRLKFRLAKSTHIASLLLRRKHCVGGASWWVDILSVEWSISSVRERLQRRWRRRIDGGSTEIHLIN